MTDMPKVRLRGVYKIFGSRSAQMMTHVRAGVGKEQLAQAIYLLSELRGEPYISINCPQYREGNLSVSELFGHKKGSFTGAKIRKIQR